MLKPFVKWAGGKKQILGQIQKKIRESITPDNKFDFTFIEPFVGGGVVFLSSGFKRVIINDLNKELITTYRVIRNNPEKLMSELEEMFAKFKENEKEYYYRIRDLDRTEQYSSLSDVKVAARMVFLNKTCFNGLYRVNSEGYFNTPKGKNRILSFYNEKNIRSVSAYLNTIPEENIMCGSYKEAMRRVTMGDIVYIDPPYDYIENDGFTKYQKEGFSHEDLLELRDECDRCLEAEAFVIISNNDTKKVRDTFKSDEDHHYALYYVEEIDTKRFINCKGNQRNTGKEIIIVGIPNGFPKSNDPKNYSRYLCLKDTNLLKNPDYLKKRFGIKKSTVYNELATLQYFGLLDFDMNLTDQGVMVRKSRISERNIILKSIIVSKDIFKETYEHDKSNIERKYTCDDIGALIKKQSYRIKTKQMLTRAKTVRNIVDWCLTN